MDAPGPLYKKLPDKTNDRTVDKDMGYLQFSEYDGSSWQVVRAYILDCELVHPTAQGQEANGLSTPCKKLALF